ncbi:hypothetical protein EV356DRAFT_513662 [Viridothelium virens]|uniref:tRNA pseudouridine synthase 1 n=1 Tax=Viridothelium virens TaxID=1048519 RepID=A0A6A6HE85_VIRVR|nr:hypothetical protein EV356DRAFT_513662 [Viridothelium virens]
MANTSESHQPPASSSGSQKRKWYNDTVRNGSRKHGDKRDKGRDLGRKSYHRQDVDKRQRNELDQEKRRKLDTSQRKESILPKPFSEEEIAAEERRPKHKVAVMIGYAGSGYKGMQINWSEKTIEGDLFHAFVKAGAISKANANDPKKSSLVRCARTDKGVHAAGNVISLKLIIEDGDVVKKINTHLPAQIRVWGIERTIGSFSCYQACDSRWYEYLIPTHSLLPPHPSSFLARELEKTADEVGDREGYEERQIDVANFWQSVDETDIKPILESLDNEIRPQVTEALYKSDEHFSVDAEHEDIKRVASPSPTSEPADRTEHETPQIDTSGIMNKHTARAPDKGDIPHSMVEPGFAETLDARGEDPNAENPKSEMGTTDSTDSDIRVQTNSESKSNPALMSAIKRLRNAYLDAKRRYRVSPSRIARLQTALNAYEGTHNFYNYTIQKTGRDPSAKRHIKSFKVSPQPILKRLRGNEYDQAKPEKGEEEAEAEETEWLSLKVHGQSFMMHQIRKMVGMAVLAVRCGADAVPLIQQSYHWNTKFSIPKAPGLGLLLERPVFESYNQKVEDKFKERTKVGFEQYEKEISEFKDREIYGRVFGEEQRNAVFHSFWGHIDRYREPYFLYVTSKGWEATKGAKYGSAEKAGGEKVADLVQSDDEEIETEGAEGEGREG